jgi:1,4-dihydroxy-2-naphthoyl-CoA hydrolase
MIWKNKPTIESLHERSLNTMSDYLKIEFLEIGDDYLKAKMPVFHGTKQPMGMLHGGASAVLAETLGSICSVCCVDHLTSTIVGLELNANHIKGVKEGYVFATSKPIHIGKSTHVWNIEIRNEHGEMVCVSRLTVMVLIKS